MSTVHANTTRDAFSRLETMVMMAGMDLPVKVIREQISHALNVVVHQARLRDGTRHITQISEIAALDLALVDFPPHDPRGDYLVLLQTQGTTLAETRDLNALSSASDAAVVRAR